MINIGGIAPDDLQCFRREMAFEAYSVLEQERIVEVAVKGMEFIA